MIRNGGITLILFVILFMTGNIVLGQSLTLQGSLTLPICTAIAASGSTVYTATSTQVYVISASNPSSPAVVGQVPFGNGEISQIAIRGNYLYCAAGTGGLIIVDVSDPAHPVIPTHYSYATAVQGVAVRDTFVAIGTYNNVALLGVRAPATPHLLASRQGWADWLQFDASGELHAGGNYGVNDISIVVSVSDGDTTFSLTSQHSYGDNNVASPLALVGSYLDVAQTSVLAALNTSNYMLVGEYQATGTINGVAGIPGWAFITITTGSVVMLDQRSGVPLFAASAGVPASPTGLAIAQSGTQPLVAVSHNAGVSVYAYQPLSAGDVPVAVPQKFSLSVYPNPFNSVAELELTVPQSGKYELVLYDILGNEARHETLQLSGTTSRQLNFSGRTAGMYFVRLSGGTRSAVTKLMYLP